MFKKFLAVILAGLMMLSLCACGTELPGEEEQQEQPQEQSSVPEEEAPAKPEAETDDFENQAVTITKIICGTQISARKNFEFKAEDAEYLGFILTVAAGNYPYEGVFAKDENGLYHFPEDEIERVVYEVFGIEGYKFPDFAGIDYDSENREFTSGLEFGIGGGPSVKEPSASSNGNRITVDFVLTDNVGFKGEPGWIEYGDFRTTFTIMEGENGSFLRFETIECIGLFEPLIIAEHITALNEVFAETFFTDYDLEDESYVRLFKEEQTNGTPADAVPDIMVSREDIKDGIPEGYYEDAGDADCYIISNFSSKEEIRRTLGAWLADEIFDGEGLTAIDNNIIEFDGRLFMVRGGRGYGVERCSGFEITEQTETEIKAVGTYYVQGDPSGTIDLVFSVDGSRMILESYTINRTE